MERLTNREFKKLKKQNCNNYKNTLSFATKCVNDDIIDFEMFQDLMDLLTYFRIKEEVK